MLCLFINVESNGYSQEFSAQILTNLVDCYTMRIVNDDEFLCDGGPSLKTLKFCFVTDNLGLVLTFDLSYRYTIYSQKPIELSSLHILVDGEMFCRCFIIQACLVFCIISYCVAVLNRARGLSFSLPNFLSFT